MTQSIVCARKLLLYGILLLLTRSISTNIDGRLEKRPISKEATYLDSCAEEIDQWSCNQELDTSEDEVCIRKDEVCNNKKDCKNGNDEKNCPDCSTEGFKCQDKKCIPESFECDGDNDCGDWTDEGPTCSEKPCKSGYVRCNSGKCIEDDKTCNGFRDCPDGDDELFITCRNNNDEWYITLVVIGVLLFMVVLCSVVTTKCRKIHRTRERPSNRGVNVAGRTTSISMEMTFPSGPPSYQATMSATMSVNPAFTDGNSIVSGDIPTDDDLPPPYETVVAELYESLEPTSQNNTTSERQSTLQMRSEPERYSSRSISSSEGTDPPTVIRTESEHSSSLVSIEPESLDDAPIAMEEEGRHI